MQYRSMSKLKSTYTGFGHDGPEGGRAGYDQIAQGEAGLMSMTGSAPDDPQRVGVPIGDLLSGIYGAFGVVAALLERTTTNRGGVVRASLLSALVGVHAFQGTRQSVAGETPRAQGNHHPSIAPYGLFRCADGAVQISVGSPALWERFCARFGLDVADPRFASNALRVQHRDELIHVIEAAFAPFSATELLGELEVAGVPAGRVRSLDEVYAWDQVASQGLLVDVEHSTLGRVTLPGPPLRFFAAGVGAGAGAVDAGSVVDGADAPASASATDAVDAASATAALGGAAYADEQGAEHEVTFRGHRAPPTLNEHGAAIRSWIAERQISGVR